MKYQFMPLFWGDFLANTMHLSAQEIGAYFLLIAHAWEHDGWIPYDRAQRIARMDNRHWGKVRARLEEFFTIEPSTEVFPRRYVHGRVLRELSKGAEISNKRKGAALQMHSKSRANASDLHMHLQLQLPKDNLNVSEQSNERASPPAASPRPQPTAAWHPRIDEADDYRSPPRQKSDNDLSDSSRDDLQALAKRRS